MTERIAFYNLDNNRDDDVVAAELRAAAEREYAFIGLCETIGNRLIQLRGYERISDDSTRSRQNIAAYVRNDIPIHNVRWEDCTTTWPRTEGPGIHEPRSWLLTDVGERDTQVIVGHQPSKYVLGAQAAQQEGIDVCVRYMAPWKRAGFVERLQKHQREAKRRPRIALADWNKRAGELGPGPDMLASRIGGRVHGFGIDAMVSRNVKVHDWSYVQKFNDLRLRSDHHHAFEAEVAGL